MYPQFYELSIFNVNFFMTGFVAVIALVSLPVIIRTAEYNDTVTCEDPDVSNLTESEVLK